MFNSWASLTGALSKREKRIEKLEKERSKSCSAVQTQKSKITADQKSRSLSTRSAPSKLSITKVDAECVKKECNKHGFTPIKLSEKPKQATPPLSFMQEKFGTRKRTYSGRNKTDKIEKASKTPEPKITDYNQYHIKVWQQAYSFGCR